MENGVRRVAGGAVAGPALARESFAAVFAVICLSCVVRLATGRRAGAGSPGRHEDLAQVVMGLGMIAMCLSWTGVGPRAVLLVVFGVEVVGFAGLLLGGNDHAAGRNTWECVHHLMASLAMVYMALALSGESVTGSMALAPLAGAFGMYFLLYTGWAAARMAAAPMRAASNGGAGGVAAIPVILRRPRVIEGCRALMGAGMAYLLLAGM
jgi:hypothetical protein